MEIIFRKDASVTGRLSIGSGYSITPRTRNGKTHYYAVRTCRYRDGNYSDDRHAQFILTIAKMAVQPNKLLITDIRLTVRELADARCSLVSGSPLSDFSVNMQHEFLHVICNIIGMRLRKVKPNSILDAWEVLRLQPLLENIFSY